MTERLPSPQRPNARQRDSTYQTGQRCSDKRDHLYLRGHHRYHQYEDSLGQDDVGGHSVSPFENAKYAISRDGIFAKISGYHGLGAGVENAEVFERPWLRLETVQYLAP